MDTDIGVARFDIRSFAEILPETVANRVLDAQSHEIERLQRTFDRRRHHAHGVGDRKVIRPQLAHGQTVDVLLLDVRPLDDMPQDARGDTRLQVGAVADRPLAREKHPAVHRLEVFTADAAQFIEQQFFKPARADRKIFVHVRRVSGRQGKERQGG
ncbi:hypothetical protein SDC9_171819 [bioreactor metagenome]|uniref:Uncharacterized protein n=1 Tax=bioreactor metagenome TaxID=1076179 RepID=A0A645GEA8_9ZZZZ